MDVDIVKQCLCYNNKSEETQIHGGKMRYSLISMFLLVSISICAQTIIQPQNIEINKVGNHINLLFDSVPSAAGYRIESSQSINGPFLPIGFTYTNSYSLSINEDYRSCFYRVVSIFNDETQQTQINENTLFVDESFQNAVLFITDSYIVLNRTRVYLTELFPNQILVSSPFNLAPSGFIRKITEIEENNNYVVLRTELATLAEIADQISIQSIRQLTADDIESTEYYIRGVTYERGRTDRTTIVYNFNNVSIDMGDPEVHSVLNGDISMNIDYLFDLDISIITHINKAQFQVDINGACNLNTSCTIINGTITKSISILKHKFIPFFIPGTPIFITPEFILKLEMSYTGNGTISVSLNETYDYHAGIVYQDNQWIHFYDGNNNFQATPPEISEDYSLNIGIGPDIRFKVFDVVGPFFNALGGVDAYTNYNTDPWKVGRVYLNGNIGFSIDAFVANISSGLFNIEIFSQTMFEYYKIKTPVITPSGGCFNQVQNSSIFCDTPNVEIRYTTDGSEPTESSNLYMSPFQLDVSSIIVAKAFKADYPPSESAQEDYTYYCLSPEISPSDGTYYGEIGITMSCTTENVQIRYTFNGSEPTQDSQLYTGIIHINTSGIICAKAFKDGWTASTISSRTYNIVCNNIIVNGYFTEGEESWNIVDFSVGSSHSIILDNGNTYIQLNHLYPGLHGSWNALGQEVRSRLIQGCTYKVSVDYKLNASIYNNSFKIRFADNSLIMHSSVISPLVDGQYAINDDNWHKIEATFLCTWDNPQSSEPMLAIFFDYDSVGYLCIDNVILELLEQ